MTNHIRDHRTERGLTQQQLADACNVSRQTIISIEASRYEPTTKLALKLAAALKVKVETLFQLEKGD